MATDFLKFMRRLEWRPYVSNSAINADRNMRGCIMWNKRLSAWTEVLNCWRPTVIPCIALLFPIVRIISSRAMTKSINVPESQMQESPIDPVKGLLRVGRDEKA